MRAIFISYRRDDSEGEAGRLYDDLVSRFGEASVFMDVAAIEVGRDFRKVIDESVATCGVLLAVIGKNWIEAKNEAGQRRLENPSDFVRLETASALKRDIPVVPVLVQGARMPHAEQLPDDLKDLAYRNGVELTHARWGSDLQLLIKALRSCVENPGNAAGLMGKGVAQPAPIPAQLPQEEKPQSGIRPKQWWKSPAAISVFVLIAVFAVAYILWPKNVSVPDVTGIPLSDAVTKLRAANLAVGVATYQEDPNKKPDTVLYQSPSPNVSVKIGTAINLVVARRPAIVPIPVEPGKLSDASHGSPSHSPNSPQFPDFAGTWQMIGVTFNGVPQPVKPNLRVTIIQKGALVRINDLDLNITNTGTVTSKRLFAHDNQNGHAVQTEDEADLVITYTWTLKGSILALDVAYNYKRQYFTHPQGTDLETATYQRVALQ